MTGSLAKATFETTGESTMSGLPSRAAIEAAIKKTEYKYFGYYEMSDDQLAAVDVLVECGLALIDHLEADGGLIREANDILLMPDYSQKAHQDIIRRLLSALPVLGVGR